MHDSIEAAQHRALVALAEHPRVLQATEVVRQASAQLRWNEALRRRWREARAEAALHSAVNSASIEGAPVPLAVLRRAIAAGEVEHPNSGDTSLDVAAGIWRAGVRLNALMPDLRGPLRPQAPRARALIAGLHRDCMTPLVCGSTLEIDEVALVRRDTVPREGGPTPAPVGEELKDRFEHLLALIEAPVLPALVRVAIVHAEMANLRPFSAGNAAVGRLLVRYLCARDGLEVTGVCVPDAYPASAPGAYAQAIGAYSRGSAQGVIDWIEWQAQAIVMGIERAGQICRSIQAGVPD